jgi:hypothetical protein
MHSQTDTAGPELQHCVPQWFQVFMPHNPGKALQCQKKLPVTIFITMAEDTHPPHPIEPVTYFTFNQWLLLSEVHPENLSLEILKQLTEQPSLSTRIEVILQDVLPQVKRHLSAVSFQPFSHACLNLDISPLPACTFIFIDRHYMRSLARHLLELWFHPNLVSTFFSQTCSLLLHVFGHVALSVDLHCDTAF